MASNYTENYGLCQWEATDQVLRTEFNEDNAKVDTILAGKLGPIQMIGTISTANPTKLTIPLEDIDWSKWTAVGITLDVHSAGDSNPPRIFFQTVSTKTSVRQYCSTAYNGYLVMTGCRPAVIILLPMKDPERRVQCLYVGSSSGMGYADCMFQELTALSGAHLDGTSFSISQKFPIWGIA